STAPRSWSEPASRRSATSASTRSPKLTAAGASPIAGRLESTGSRSTSACDEGPMFTGLITDIGTVRSAEQRGDLRLVIGCGYDLAGIELGASIACSGTCLTVVDRGADEGGSWFAVDLSAETVARTAAGLWKPGAHLNLERALRVGDEL